MGSKQQWENLIHDQRLLKYADPLNLFKTSFLLRNVTI